MWNKKDLLGIREMSKEEIFTILDTAKEMKIKIDHSDKRDDSLKSESVVTVFFENSTRTKMSFVLAGEYLGAKVVDCLVSASSVNKGETLIDTGINLDQMGTGCIVIRHQMTGAAHLLAKNVKASVINAGDGINEHPTQALLDFFTIYEKLGSFEGLKVAIIGDINHSRVVRSNIFGLKKLGANVVLAGPSTLISSDMKALGADVTTDRREALENADVVMGLRIQLERQKAAAFPDLREYKHFFGIDSEMLKLAKKDVLVMHPQPLNRGVEFTTDVIEGKNSVLNEQVKNGAAVRMAILKLLLGGK